MWLAIIALVDKIFGILGQLTGFWITRSDARKKARDEYQTKMDQAVKDGNNDDYWTYRSRRNAL